MQTFLQKVNKMKKNDKKRLKKMHRNDKKRLKKIKQDNKQDMLGISTESIEDSLQPKFNFKVFLITAVAFFFLGQVAI